MSNMSYIRFENTYKDLLDCIEHWDDELSEDEKIYRRKMLRKMCDVIGMYSNDIDEALDDFMMEDF